MIALKIFSYLPNPRVWKTTIAADLLGLDVELVGAKPAELANWLWDFDARPLDAAERDANGPWARRGKRGFDSVLYKTDDFLRTQPFGTVPAAFSPDGSVGIFESNSILRALARQRAGLYGASDFEASRIDSFLDANLVFAREAQVYLLALQSERLDAATYARMRDAYEFYLSGIEQALQHGDYLCDTLSIADISFACDFCQFQRELYFAPWLAAQDSPTSDREPISAKQTATVHGTDPAQDAYPAVAAYLIRLLGVPEIDAALTPYVQDLRARLAS